jgi:hypothetical protein
MPHTHSRYQQDLGFTDGLLFFPPADFTATGGPPTLVRNAIGDIVYQAPVSATTYFNVDLMDGVIRRSGFFEDTQNTFGSSFGGGLGGPIAGPSGSPGTGIPASAEPQGRPGSPSLQDGFILPGTPQPVSAMGALQQITPRTALKIKGFKPTALTVVYKVVTGAATSLTTSITQTIFKNGQAVATGQTTPLAASTTTLTNVVATTPYVTVIPIPNAIYYQITPLTQLWFELAVVEPASNTFQLYGIELNCEFNFN